MVVKIMVPFWVPIIVRHLIFRVPKRDHNFDNHTFAVNKKDYNAPSFGLHGGWLSDTVMRCALRAAIRSLFYFQGGSAWHSGL